MRNVISIGLTVFCLMASATSLAAATPTENAEYLIKLLVPEDYIEAARAAVTTGYANRLSDSLKEHSVRVVDQDALEEHLPRRIADEWEDSFHQNSVALLVGNYSAAELEEFAEHARFREAASPVNPVSKSEPIPITELANELNDTVEAIRREPIVEDVNLAMLLVGIVLHESRVRSTPEPVNLSAPHVTELLETEGLFRFPNPVLRRDLIRKSRDGDL